MKRMIIFDLDGTLIDTLDDLKNAVNFALEKFEFPLRTKENIRKDIGNGTVKLIGRSAPSGTSEKVLKELHSIFKEYYSKHMLDFTKPYDGIASLLFSLKAQGYKLAVVSNKDHDLTIQIINRFFFGMFDYVQGSYMEHPKKPDPYLISKVEKDANILSNEITYIGDTNVDEQTARNSNLNYIIVSYGYRTKEELKTQVITKRIVDSVKEIEEEIKR